MILENTSVKYRILEAAKPYLEGKTVQDLVVGISLIAVQLSDESVGVSYVLRYGLPPECAAFGYARNAVGMSAWDVAQWSVEGKDNVARSIGGAVLAAASQQPRGSVRIHGAHEITRYSCCCNTNRGIYYYTTYENSRITGIDVHRENLDGSKPIRYPHTKPEFWPQRGCRRC